MGARPFSPSNFRRVDRDNLINDPEIVSMISCQGRATWSDPPDPRCTRRCENDEREREREGEGGGGREKDPKEKEGGKGGKQREGEVSER